MKPKLKKVTKKSLSDKIADALTIKPRPDIEDDHIFNTKANIVTRADLGTSDSEDETLISDFRKQNIHLLSDISKKYEGQVISRKELNESGSDEESINDIEKTDINSASDSDESEESQDYSISNARKRLHSSSSNEEKANVGEEDSHSEGDEEVEEQGEYVEDEEDEGEENEDDEDGYDISQMEQPMKEQFEHVKKQNVSEEAKKGICVRNQLLLWEGLLEMRIHLQRCVNSANTMPISDVYEELKESKEFVENSSAAITNVSNVIDKLQTLQNLLLNKYPETNALTDTKKVKDKKQNEKEESDEEIPSDTDNEEIPSDTDAEEDSHKNIETKITTGPTRKRKFEDYENDIATSHTKFKKFRDTTIQKWNEKTRVATAANIKSAPTNTILQQISYILSDKNKLVRRTQLKRSDYDIIGYKKESANGNEKNVDDLNPIIQDRKSNDEYIPEIFDDSDFYHQLLRELIECKSADISDPVQLSRQWIALQQMRSKMKRKVDTKATKGRKIKYAIHSKLINFMAQDKTNKWSDESTNELYSSLFGKMFEQNNVGVNANLDILN